MKKLIEQIMKDANSNDILIVRTINHEFNHRCVLHNLPEYPNLFKDLLLYNPPMTSSISAGSTSPNESSGEFALNVFEDLLLKGFRGACFHLNLWKRDKNDGLDIYKCSGEYQIFQLVLCASGHCFKL